MPGQVIKLMLAVFALLACACDGSSRSPDSESQPSEPLLEASAATTEPEPSVTPTEPVEPAQPPPPIGGPHCDQREVGDGEAKCIDYTEHSGVGTPRCFGDVPLGEGPCPSDGVIATCKLPATGVTLVYYEGTKTDAAKQICSTIDGTFAQP